MFAASGGFNYFSQTITTIGRATAISGYTLSKLFTQYDSSGNLFFINTYNNAGTNNVLTGLLATNGTITFSESWANTTNAKNPKCALINSTQASGYYYASIGSAQVAGNPYSEAMALNSSGSVNTVGVWFGPTGTQNYINYYGGYIDTTANLTIYGATESVLGRYYILKGTSTSTTYNPSGSQSITYAAGTFTPVQFVYATSPAYGLTVANTLVGSITSATFVLSSGSTFSTSRGISVSGLTSRPSTYAAMCTDKSSTTAAYCVGTVVDGSSNIRFMISKINISTTTPSFTWTKVFQNLSTMLSINDVDTDSSGNIYMLGQTNGGGYAEIIKLDSSGNVVAGYTLNFFGGTVTTIVPQRINIIGTTMNIVLTTDDTSNQTVVLQLPADGTGVGTTFSFNGNSIDYYDDTSSWAIDTGYTITTATPTFSASSLLPSSSTTSRTATNRTLTTTTSTL